MELRDLAERLKSDFLGAPDLEVAGLCDPHVRRADALLFVERPEKGVPGGAGAYLVPESFRGRQETGTAGWLFCADPRRAFHRCLELFDPHRQVFREGRASHLPAGCSVGRNVFIGAGVILHASCRLGDEVMLMGNNFIGPGVSIGSRVVLHPGVVIEAGCRIGSDVTIHANTVIGSDGFGYESGAAGHAKIPQIGVVEIADHVEIGSNVSIDRATVGATRIGRGSKIDNLVQIAHNVQIGEGCLLAGQSGVAGSSQLGRGVILAGQAGVSDHADLGDGVVLTAQAGIVSGGRVPPGAVLGGSPSIPLGEHKRQFVYLRRLPELFKNKKEKEG